MLILSLEKCKHLKTVELFATKVPLFRQDSRNVRQDFSDKIYPRSCPEWSEMVWEGQTPNIHWPIKIRAFHPGPGQILRKKLKLSILKWFTIGPNKRAFPDKHYQTVFQSDVQKMYQKKRKTAVSSCLRSQRKYTFVEK